MEARPPSWKGPQITGARPYIYSFGPRLFYLVGCFSTVIVANLGYLSVPLDEQRQGTRTRRWRRTHKSRDRARERVSPIPGLTEPIRSGCNAFMAACPPVPRPSRFLPALQDPLDVLRRPKDSVLCHGHPRVKDRPSVVHVPSIIVRSFLLPSGELQHLDFKVPFSLFF